MSLRQIADRTKLSVRALEALERNEISRLPGGIFSRGFVRSYAIEIGLDPEQTVRDFLIQFPNDSVSLGSPHASAQEFGADGSSRRSSTGVMLVVVVTLLIAAVLIFVFVRP